MIDMLTYVRESTDLLGVGIELVHAIQGSSAKATFNFGFNCGVVTAVFYAVVPAIYMIAPKEWQRFIGLDIDPLLKGDKRKKLIKKEVAKIVEGKFPGISLYGKRGGLLDGRADATAIAYTLFHKFIK